MRFFRRFLLCSAPIAAIDLSVFTNNFCYFQHIAVTEVFSENPLYII